MTSTPTVHAPQAHTTQPAPSHSANTTAPTPSTPQPASLNNSTSSNQSSSQSEKPNDAPQKLNSAQSMIWDDRLIDSDLCWFNFLEAAFDLLVCCSFIFIYVFVSACISVVILFYSTVLESHVKVRVLCGKRRQPTRLRRPLCRPIHRLKSWYAPSTSSTIEFI